MLQVHTMFVTMVLRSSYHRSYEARNYNLHELNISIIANKVDRTFLFTPTQPIWNFEILNMTPSLDFTFLQKNRKSMAYMQCFGSIRIRNDLRGSEIILQIGSESVIT